MKLIDAILQKQESQLIPIIAEIKRCIPSVPKKSMKDQRSAAFLAKQYELGGACGISIVCEKKHFGGQPELDIPTVLEATKLPILIKDFISTKEQVRRYKNICPRSKNFSKYHVSLLLIAHHLKNKLQDIAEYCYKEGLYPFVEIKNIKDLDYIVGLALNTFLVGFNNRDIDKLETRENKTIFSADIISHLRSIYKGVVVSESGHKTIKDVLQSIKAGADAVLIGQAIMLAKNPSRKVHSFVFAKERGRFI